MSGTKRIKIKTTPNSEHHRGIIIAEFRPPRKPSGLLRLTPYPQHELCQMCKEPLVRDRDYGIRDVNCFPCRAKLDRAFERECLICEALMAGLTMAEARGGCGQR